MARIFVCAALASGVAASNKLVLLPESEYGAIGGRCMDGSMAGYYYGVPSSGQSSLWVIYLDGGGACGDEKSCKQWNKKSGSSDKWHPTETGANNHQSIMSPDPSANPDFHDAHHVHVPYCTADGHSGQVVEPTADQWGYYFSGHLNFKNIMQHVIDNHDVLHHMDRVLLTGSSPGGIGVFNNCDFLQDFLAQAGSHAQVSCAPIAGWFVPGYTEDHDDPLAPPSLWQDFSAGSVTPSVRPTKDLWLKYRPKECVEALSPSGEDWKCGSATAIYPHVRSPMFIVQNWYDPVQVHSEFGLPKDSYSTSKGQEFAAYFGRAMQNSTNLVVNHPSDKKGDGIFLASCFDHGDGIHFRHDDGTQFVTQLKGHTSFEAVADWFYDRKQVPAILVDDCQQVGPGLPCNPTCDGLPTTHVV